MKKLTVTFGTYNRLSESQLLYINVVMVRYNPILIIDGEDQILTLSVDPDLDSNSILKIGMLLQACTSVAAKAEAVISKF